MRLTISGKNFTLTEGIKDAAEEKIKKIERLIGDDASVAVLVSAKKEKKEKSMQKGQRSPLSSMEM